MKLRIRGNSIRLRLLRGEVAALVESGKIEETTEFGAGQRFEYALLASEDVPRPCATFRAGRIEVLLPIRLAREWAGGDEVSIRVEQRLGCEGDAESRSLSLLIEKDFACVKPPPGEDQSDAFANPEGLKCAGEE